MSIELVLRVYVDQVTRLRIYLLANSSIHLFIYRPIPQSVYLPVFQPIITHRPIKQFNFTIMSMSFYLFPSFLSLSFFKKTSCLSLLSIYILCFKIRPHFLLCLLLTLSFLFLYVSLSISLCLSPPLSLSLSIYLDASLCLSLSLLTLFSTAPPKFPPSLKSSIRLVISFYR